jgi:uncharacterized SAM-binding protein YcdF (DUF218 family)
LRRFRWLILLGIAAVGLYVYPAVVLAPLGRYLVLEDGAERCDCMFVLAGDQLGSRILKSAELYRAGMAPKLFVSGAGQVFGKTEDALAIAFARENGAADVPFIGLPNDGNSTISEGRLVYPVLREAGCGSVMVVTSNFHTRRAGNILRRVWPGMRVRMVSAKTADYDPETWWTERVYQKVFLLEWTKTVTDWFGI